MMSHMTGDAGYTVPTWQNKPVASSEPKHNCQEGIGSMVSNLPQDRHVPMHLVLPLGTVLCGSTAMYSRSSHTEGRWSEAAEKPD
jgi:hypothetical protein